MYNRQKVIDIALAEVNYLEKKSNDGLDAKASNAGSKNYTKYARDLDKLKFFNGAKQGEYWCAVFVCWCFVQAFGEKVARTLLYLPSADINYAAGCEYAFRYFKNNEQIHTSPQIGDQIFFWNSGKTKKSHTGLVYSVDNSYVYTIEGNTSGSAGIVDNGGGVFKKKYALNNARIAGYGRPKYGSEKTITLTFRQLRLGSSGNEVKTLQRVLNAIGYSCGSVDGDFGSKTDKALRSFQSARKLTADGIAGKQTLTALYM